MCLRIPHRYDTYTRDWVSTGQFYLRSNAGSMWFVSKVRLLHMWQMPSQFFGAKPSRCPSIAAYRLKSLWTTTSCQTLMRSKRS